MTNIFSVDATPLPQQRDNYRPTSKDFAQELAKHDEQIKPSLQDNANAKMNTDSDGQPMSGSAKTVPAEASEPAVEASPMQTSAATLSEAQLLAEAVVTPTGVTEALLGARVFGWHAMAQAYLSELTAADGDANRRTTSSAQRISANAAADESIEMQAASTPVVSALVEAATAAPQSEQVTQVQPRIASDDPASPNVAELSTADASSTSYWSERSLRFTRQRDGASVAWLRDFRISDTEASHLIQIVLNDAKAKGLVLSKIMLNGREAWTSPSTI